MALAAFLGLTLGVAALVISIALLAGFQRHVRGKLVSETPHLLVQPAGRPDFRASEGVEPRLRALPGVSSVSPIVRGRVWVTVRGQAMPSEAVGRAGVDGLMLDLSQARTLAAFPGDTLTLISSRSRLSPLGPVPIVTSEKLTDLAPPSSGRRSAELTMPLAEARRLFAMGEDAANGYEVSLADPFAASAAADEVRRALGAGVVATTWEEANRAVVLALKLERLVLFATVFLIVIVAGLNLAATSAVLAATRSQDAAVLSVLGASPRTVSAVFRAAGAGVGVAGTLAGLALGIALAVILDRTGAVPLPAQLYALNHVPFRVEPLDVAAVALLSMLWSLVTASLPARAAARLPVAEVLRGG